MAHIILIDDDADTRRVLGELLVDAGHRVKTAGDGKEGIAALNESPVDLVITDLFMPNREGLETITHLKRAFPALPIIAMSGNAVADTMLSIARRLGAACALQKPFFPDELLTAVDAALNGIGKQVYEQVP